MKIGGPIEAKWTTDAHTRRAIFPPMKIGGPIEARELSDGFQYTSEFPPMKIGGPIEAGPTHHRRNRRCPISADENRRPH